MQPVYIEYEKPEENGSQRVRETVVPFNLEARSTNKETAVILLHGEGQEEERLEVRVPLSLSQVFHAREDAIESGKTLDLTPEGVEQIQGQYGHLHGRPLTWNDMKERQALKR